MSFLVMLLVCLPIILILELAKWRSAENQRIERQKFREENRIRQIENNKAFVSSIAYDLSHICQIHELQFRPYNWIAIANKKPPFANGTDGPKTFQIKSQIDALLCGEAPENATRFKQSKYQDLLIKLRDAENAEAKMYKEWEGQHNLAVAILSKDCRFYEKAFEFAGARTVIESISNTSRIDFKQDSAYCFFRSNAEEIVPSTDYSLTKAGNVSQRPMGSTKRHQIICEYVCSSVLRAAQILFSTLPISMVRIDVDSIIEDAYGEKTVGPVICLIIDRLAFLEHFDSSLPAVDQLYKYGAIMDILKTRGFKRIKATDPNALDITELEEN